MEQRLNRVPARGENNSNKVQASKAITLKEGQVR
jgi:hypothetical protein